MMKNEIPLFKFRIFCPILSSLGELLNAEVNIEISNKEG